MHPEISPDSRQQHTKDQRRRKRAKQQLKRQITEQQRADTALAYETCMTIKQYFPDLFDQLRTLDEVWDENWQPSATCLPLCNLLIYR